MMRQTMRRLALASLALIAVPRVAAHAQSPTARIVRNANAFLATLEPAQRQRVLFAFDDDKQRVRWSNLPDRMVQRAGLSMGELTTAQRTAVMTLLSSALSPRGFEKVQQIVEGDEVLKRTSGNNPMFGKDLFFVSILGTPSETAPWMLQFGGHHLALNITIVGANGVLTPSLTAAQPALYTENGRTVRPLGAESDKAFALLNSLDSTQRAKAILGYRVADLVLGPGQDGKTIQPEGLKATSMNAKQRALLLDLIGEWSGIVHEGAAAARMAEIKSGLDDSWFAWSGSTTHAEGHSGTAYYRIQGPALVIEYAPQPLGGDPTNHIHTIYRDPTNDYGRKLTSK
jgi:hypothetical protein